MNINTITEILNKNGFTSTKQMSSKRLFVLVPAQDRIKVLNEIVHIFKKYGASHNPKLYKISSLGAIEIDDLIIGIKPSEKQGDNNSGIQNELFLIHAIKSFLRKHKNISVKFKSGNKQVLYKNIVGIKHTGRITLARQKADIILTNSVGNIIPISIKKDNAKMWESADTYYKAKAKKYLVKLLKNHKVKINKNGISPKVAIQANTKESNDVIFGSDIKNKGVVIQRSFLPEDFHRNRKTLTIDCSYLFRNLNDLPDKHKPWFCIGPCKSRSIQDFFPGLRIIARYQLDAPASTHLRIKTS